MYKLLKLNAYVDFNLKISKNQDNSDTAIIKLQEMGLIKYKIITLVDKKNFDNGGYDLKLNKLNLYNFVTNKWIKFTSHSNRQMSVEYLYWFKFITHIIDRLYSYLEVNHL